MEQLILFSDGTDAIEFATAIAVMGCSSDQIQVNEYHHKDFFLMFLEHKFDVPKGWRACLTTGGFDILMVNDTEKRVLRLYIFER